MTSMPVKEVGMTIGKGMVKGAGSAAKTAQSGFEAVWNSQTAKSLKNDVSNGTDTTKETGKTQSYSENKEVSGSEQPDELKETSVKEQKISDKQISEKQQPDAVEEPDELEKAMEVLATTAMELLQQIADGFQVSAENVESAMDELGMDLLDLLQTDSLGQLLLKMGGADDSTQLLTNENLYRDYKTLMAQQERLLENAGQTLTQSPDGSLGDGMLNELIARVKDTAVTSEDAAEPVITVETSEDVEAPQDKKDGTVKEVAMPDSMQTEKNAAAKEATGKDAKQQGSNQGHGTETGTNPTLQQLKSDLHEMQGADSAQRTSKWDMDTQNIMRQIMDYMRIQLKPGEASLEMQLHPASLGSVQVQIASKGGAVTAQFVTQNEAVKAALESQMIQLKESFAEQGVKVEAIEVTVQTHEFERNLDQGRGREQGEPEKKNRIRRVHLNGGLSMEELEDMEEENRLVADMMMANGNSVDYTA